MDAGRGYIHLYTGDGKGKTTAAVGLCIRAAGAGKKVYMAQFVKGRPYAELAILKSLPGITVRQFGMDCFIIRRPEQEDIDAARKGFTELTAVLAAGEHDLVVLDEICIALHYHLIGTGELIRLLRKKPSATEIVLTGRYAPKILYDYADLVTEMKEIKHYYHAGVMAREGIEY